MLASPSSPQRLSPRNFLKCCSFASTARRLRTYDDFVNVFDASSTVQIKNVSEERGFRLTDNLEVPGPLVLLNDVAFLWDAPLAPQDFEWREWTNEHWVIFDIATPRPDVLIVGTGKRPIPLAPRLQAYFSSLGIQIDVQDTRNACSVYNLLAEEGRRVAAALLPLRHMDPKTEMLKS